MEWEKLFKRYVWNDKTTPYLTPVAKLNRDQAHSEILFYCLFHGVLFAVITIVMLTGGPQGKSSGAALYSFSVVCAAVVFGMLKNYPAALYLSATPLVGLAYLFIYRFGSDIARIDTFVVFVVLVLLLRYSLRIVGVARNYPDMPPAPPDDR